MKRKTWSKSLAAVLAAAVVVAALPGNMVSAGQNYNNNLVGGKQ